MTVLAIILYVLGVPLGILAGFAVNHKGWRIVFCAVFWPIVSLISFAGLCAAYSEVKKGML